MAALSPLLYRHLSDICKLSNVACMLFDIGLPPAQAGGELLGIVLWSE